MSRVNVSQFEEHLPGEADYRVLPAAQSRHERPGGGVLLTSTVKAAGLDAALSAAMAPWRPANAVHDPAKVITDLALTLALGGDCLADIALLRSEPGVYGLVASDATASRTIDALAKDAPAALKAINTARSAARARGRWPGPTHPITPRTRRTR